MYAAVGRAVSAHVGHPYDDKCKILTQPCFYSWHPEAYYNPGAIAFEMPAESVTKVTETETKATIAPGNAPSENGFIANFLDEFEHRNPFIRGSRNDLALKLGRAAASKGFSQEETKKLTELFAQHYAATDFTMQDIRKLNQVIIYNTNVSPYQYIVLQNRPVEREKVAEETGASHGNDESVKNAPVKNENRVGRNDMCPCGSGKKYKNCCGREA